MIALALVLLQDAELGQKAYAEGRYAEAARHFEKAIAAEGGTRSAPLLRLALGNCYLQTRDFEGAVRVLREAVRLKADGADVHRALGQALVMVGRPDEALPSLRRAARLDPEGPDALWIARVFIRKEDWIPAEQALAQHLAVEPDSIEARETLAHVLSRRGRWGEAADVWRALAGRRPLEARYRVALGQAEAAAKRYGEAIDALEAARRIGHPDAEAARLLADLYLQQQMPREAAAAYGRLVAAHPARAEDWVRLGHARLQAGEEHSAREAFESALGADPGHGHATLQLARLAERRGEADAARRLFAAAAEALAGNPVPCAALGDLESRAGNWVRAAASFGEAVRRGDRSAATLHHRALALRSGGDPGRAWEALKEGLREHPFDDRLRALLRDWER